MLSLNIKTSIIEFGVVGCCHMVALIALFHVDLGGLLQLGVLLPVAVVVMYSMLRYCLSVSSIGSVNTMRKPWFAPGGRRLIIGQEQTFLVTAESERVLALPSISFHSEFLIILKFSSYLPPSECLGKSSWCSKLAALFRFSEERGLRIAIWPDSLSRADSCQLRRYLRFDCPQATLSGAP